MTWLDLLGLLEDAPLRLLKDEVIIYQHEGDGTHRDFRIDEVCCPAWDGEYWDPEDGMVLQLRLKERRTGYPDQYESEDEG